MSKCPQWLYRFLAFAVRGALRVAHPVLRVEGREKLPEGAAVLCCNHSGMTDPIWVIAFGHLRCLPCTMAKKELFRFKPLAWFLRFVGGFPVDRGATDINAVKTSLQALKSGNKLLIFPEGTRVKKGMRVEAHSGALLIGSRMKAPIVPVYLSTKRRPFSAVRVIFGEPYFPEYAGAKPTNEELERRTAELMDQIYRMGDRT